MKILTDNSLTVLWNRLKKGVLNNRNYEPTEFSGKGYKVLEKNIQTIDGVKKNILIPAMINQSNTIYEIRYDFDLNGETIKVPNDCVLKFEGGSLNNGILIGNKTSIIYYKTKIFKNIILEGTFISMLSPIMFGLFVTNSDSERFDCLYNTHFNAHKTNSKISYEGINEISIEMPQDDRRLLLSYYSDFCGCKIIVNRQEDEREYLFGISNELHDINIRASDIDSGLFSSYKELQKGIYGLVIKDNNMWSQRIGYTNNDAYRKDILLISNGKALNKVIMPYNNEDSDHICQYFIVNNGLIIKNLNIIITGRNINVIDIVNQANIIIENVTIEIPNPISNSGVSISLHNCCDINIKNLRAYGQNKDTSAYGYNILFDNSADFYGEGIITDNAWHSFGESGGLNGMTLKNCNVNPDSHYYSKDFHFIDCEFRGTSGNMNNVYGNIIYDNCNFYNYSPVVIDSSYNDYTQFNLIFNNCNYIATDNYHNYLYSTSIRSIENNRNELKKKYLPNIIIKNLYIILPSTQDYFTIYALNNTSSVNLDGNIFVKVDGLKIRRKDGTLTKLSIVSRYTAIADSVNYDIKGVDLIEFDDGDIPNHIYKYSYPAYIDFNFGINKIIEINNSRIGLNRVIDPLVMTIKNSVIMNIRKYDDTTHAKKIFSNCDIYLNNDDDSLYSLYPNALYKDCNFILSDTNRQINLIVDADIVELKDCRCNKATSPIYQGTSDGIELLGMISTGLKYIYTHKTIGENNKKPILSSSFRCLYHDTTLNKPIYWTGTKWVDATGVDV